MTSSIGLHDLYEKARILHRDVSLNNIMYEMRGSRHYFILIDFDMAIIVPSRGSTYTASSKHRTGTLPFMAFELVMDVGRASKTTSWRPIPHVLRHDFESLFWIAVWCVLTLYLMSLPKELRGGLRETAKMFSQGDVAFIASYKLQFATWGFKNSELTLPPAAQPLGQWFDAWSRLFMHGQADMANTDAPSDIGNVSDRWGERWETAGDRLTRDTLKKVLSAAYPIPAEHQLTAEIEAMDPEELNSDTEDAEAHPQSDAEAETETEAETGEVATVLATRKGKSKSRTTKKTRSMSAAQRKEVDLKEEAVPPSVAAYRSRLRVRKPDCYT